MDVCCLYFCFSLFFLFQIYFLFYFLSLSHFLPGTISPYHQKVSYYILWVIYFVFYLCVLCGLWLLELVDYRCFCVVVFCCFIVFCWGLFALDRRLLVFCYGLFGFVLWDGILGSYWCVCVGKGFVWDLCCCIVAAWFICFALCGIIFIGVLA